MKNMLIQLMLFIGMIIIGIFYGLFYHYFIMSLTKNGLIHCIVMGLIFGGLNYLLAFSIIRKYFILKADNNILRQKIKTDKLTGLLNRQSFDSDIQQLKDLVGVYSIIFVDIDNFRKFNNKFGHQVGDIILQKVSRSIQANVRPGDRVYRYGGEEIVIFLDNCGKDKAINIAERIRLNISKIDTSPYPQITISLGVASYPEDGIDISQVIKYSDKALLKAKSQGKNCTVCA